MTSLKTSIKTITYLSDIGCLEIQGASLCLSLVILQRTCNFILEQKMELRHLRYFITVAEHKSIRLASQVMLPTY